MHWSNIDGQIFTKMRWKIHEEEEEMEENEILSKSGCESASTYCAVRKYILNLTLLLLTTNGHNKVHIWNAHTIFDLL